MFLSFFHLHYYWCARTTRRRQLGWLVTEVVTDVTPSTAADHLRTNKKQLVPDVVTEVTLSTAADHLRK